MDSMEVNKGVAAVLVSGIAFMIFGLISQALVHPTALKQSAIKIEGAGAPAATTAAAAPAPLPPIAPLLAKADAAAGEKIAQRDCTACHTFTEGGRNGVGPNLYGVVGGPHAHEQGFNYSNALKSKTGDWTFDEPNEWLHKPSSYAPGTRMTFAGINSDQQRADVIAFLRSLSKNPVPLPNPTEAAAPATAAPATKAAPAAKAAPSAAAAPAAPAPPK